MTAEPDLLRSVLYMPGSNARAISKARTLPADALILDMEDAVAPEAKDEARALVRDELTKGGFGRRKCIARVNALAGPWGADDLAAIATAPLDGILVPKVNGPGDIDKIADAMKQAGIAAATPIWAMIETPLAVLNLGAIAERAQSTALAGFVLGLNDLAKDTGIAQLPGRSALQAVLTMSVIAARAHGIAIIDGVCNALDDEARLEAECLQAREGGFDGKSLIHPRQIDVANRVFAPDDDEIQEAEAIVAAFRDPENAGKGAIRVKGKMTERLHLAQAEALLAKARVIASTS